MVIPNIRNDHYHTEEWYYLARGEKYTGTGITNLCNSLREYILLIQHLPATETKFYYCRVYAELQDRSANDTFCQCESRQTSP